MASTTVMPLPTTLPNAVNRLFAGVSKNELLPTLKNHWLVALLTPLPLA